MNEALEYIKSKHNGEIPYKYGANECAKLMAAYAKEYHEHQLKILNIPVVSGSLPLTDNTKCSKCNLLGELAPCDECYFKGNYRVICCCCPVCKSENITDNSQRKSNGIYGSGFSSWKVTDTRICNECGVIFKPVKGNCI